MQAFSSCSQWATLHCSVWNLIAGVASLVVVPGLLGTQALVIAVPGIYSTGSAVVVHGQSCPTAGGISPDQRLNPCPQLPCIDNWVLNLWTSREVL